MSTIKEKMEKKISLLDAQRFGNENEIYSADYEAEPIPCPYCARGDVELLIGEGYKEGAFNCPECGRAGVP